MNRKLKGLGPALLAVLALSGIAAASAQAETPIESQLNNAKTKLDVTNDINEHGKLARLTIGTNARFIECTEIEVTGGEFTKTATTVTVTPAFGECFSNNLTSAPVTVTVNGCVLKVTALKTSTASVTSEGCKQIEVHVFENEKAQSENKPLCTYDIAAPQTITGATITTAEVNKIHALTVNLGPSSKVTKIKNTGPGGPAVCGLASGAEGEGKFDNSLIVTGTEAAPPKAQVGITLI